MENNEKYLITVTNPRVGVLNEAARHNAGKPMFSLIDFRMWDDMFDAYERTNGNKTIMLCVKDMLICLSDTVIIDDRSLYRFYTNTLQMLSYRLSLLLKDIPFEHRGGLPDLRAFEDMAYVLEYGAKKYSKDNWRKGYQNKFSTVDSLIRHLGSIIIGELNDEESGLPHIGHIMCNVMFLTNDLLFVERNEDGSLCTV